jgi:uncharacterized tellurite resistance protein B-like protein
MLEINDEKEAFMAVIYACMAADNDVSNQEYDEMIHILSGKQLYVNTDLRMIFNKIKTLHQSIGYNSFKLIELAADKINESLRLTLYAHAIEIFLSDKNFHANEKQLATYLQRALEIDTRWAKKIQEVITIKNRG